MSVLNCYLESDLVGKHAALQVVDWALTPLRKALNGRMFTLVYNSDKIPAVQTVTERKLSPLERAVWSIVAVVTLPLAAVAACFKRALSPSVGNEENPLWIGSKDHCLSSLKEAGVQLRTLKDTGLTGEVRVCIKLPEKHNAMSESEASYHVIRNLEGLGWDFCKVVQSYQVNHTKGEKFAILSCNLLTVHA